MRHLRNAKCGIRSTTIWRRTNADMAQCSLKEYAACETHPRDAIRASWAGDGLKNYLKDTGGFFCQHPIDKIRARDHTDRHDLLPDGAFSAEPAKNNDTLHCPAVSSLEKRAADLEAAARQQSAWSDQSCFASVASSHHTSTWRWSKCISVCDKHANDHHEHQRPARVHVKSLMHIVTDTITKACPQIDLSSSTARVSVLTVSLFVFRAFSLTLAPYYSILPMLHTMKKPSMIYCPLDD